MSVRDNRNIQLVDGCYSRVENLKKLIRYTIECFMDSDEQLTLYVKSLEREISNKEYFLRQAEDALEVLRREESIPKEGSTSWNDFLEKPMFCPERSDPIGLCLAFSGHRSRLQESREFLKMHSLVALKEALELQKSLNEGLESFSGLLRTRLKKLTKSKKPVAPKSAEQRNVALKEIMKILVDSFVATDLAAMGSDTDLVAREMQELIRRLIRLEILNQADFRPRCTGLYRLLKKANIIEEDHSKSVRLANFSTI